MSVFFRQPRSLKTRIVLQTLLVLVLGLWTMAYYASHALRADLLALTGRQQLSTVSVLSERIAEELVVRVAALEEVSARLGASQTPPTPQALEALVAQDPLAPRLFNSGIFFTDTTGVVRASSPLAKDRLGSSVRAQIATVLDAGQVLVGAPLKQPGSSQPELLIAVPVRNSEGRVLGAMAGVIDLAEPSFFDLITRHRYGQTGHLFLVSPQQRLVVTSSHVGRVMELLPPAGVNADIDRALADYEGTIVMTNPQGIEVLNSGRQVGQSGWDVVASLPLDEALAPAQQLHWRILGAASLLTAILGTLMGWLLRRQLAPAVAAAELLIAQTGSPHGPQLLPLPVQQPDEVGTLIAAFNRTIEALARREGELRLNGQVLKAITEAVVITGPDQVVQWTNQAHETITGYTHEELIGHNLRLLQGPLTDPATVTAMRKTLAANSSFEGEVLNYRKDGTPFWNDLLMFPLIDEQGRLTHFVGITRDVSRRKGLEQQAQHLAFHDPLTQLPNRRLLNDRLDQVLMASKRHGLYGAVMFVDIDGLKPLNDVHGHAFGDLLLTQAAQRLLSSVREIDTVARFGGDEFVVILAELTADEPSAAAHARKLAEAVRALLATPYTLHLPEGSGAPARTLEYRCSASIGVCLFMGQQPQAVRDDLLRRADAAMYRAKQSGRNAVVIDTTAD